MKIIHSAFTLSTRYYLHVSALTGISLSYKIGYMQSPETTMKDPKNGFDRIFYSVRQEIEYSLVVVPAGADFRVGYNKPSCNIDFSLTETAINYWKAIGIIDNDTFSNLGLPVSSRRYRKNPPVVSPENVEYARNRGEIEATGVSRQGQTLFKVDLELTGHMVASFFERIWNPGINPKYSPDQIPAARVRFHEEIDQLLPQKGPIGNHRKSDSVLQVFNSSTII